MDLDQVLKITHECQQQCVFVETANTNYLGFIINVDPKNCSLHLRTMTAGQYETVLVQLDQVRHIRPFTLEAAMQSVQEEQKGVEEAEDRNNDFVAQIEDTDTEEANSIFHSLLEKGKAYIFTKASLPIETNEFEDALIRGDKNAVIRLLLECHGIELGYSETEWEIIKKRVNEQITWDTSNQESQVWRLFKVLGEIHGVAEHFCTKMLCNEPTGILSKRTIDALFNIYVRTGNNPPLIYLFHEYQNLLSANIKRVMNYATALYEEDAKETFGETLKNNPELLENVSFQKRVVYVEYLLEKKRKEEVIEFLKHAPEIVVAPGLHRKLLETANQLGDDTEVMYYTSVESEIFSFPPPNKAEQGVVGNNGENSQTVIYTAMRFLKEQGNLHRQAERFLWYAVSIKPIRKHALQLLIPLLAKEKRFNLLKRISNVYAKISSEEEPNLSNTLSSQLERIISEKDENAILDFLCNHPKLIKINDVKQWREMAQRHRREDFIEFLDRFLQEPNEFEKAIIEEQSIMSLWATEKGRLAHLGYDSQEINLIGSIYRQGEYMRGSNDYAIGFRLYQFQKNKNGQALRFFERSEHPHAPSKCFELYCEEHQWYSAFRIIEIHPEMLAGCSDLLELLPHWFDALYNSGQYQKLLEEIRKYNKIVSNRQPIQQAVALVRLGEDIHPVIQTLMETDCTEGTLWSDFFHALLDCHEDELFINLLNRVVCRFLLTTSVEEIDKIASLQGKIFDNKERWQKIVALAQKQSADMLLTYWQRRLRMLPRDENGKNAAWLSEFIENNFSSSCEQKVFADNLMLLFPEKNQQIKSALLRVLLTRGKNERDAENAAVLFCSLDQNRKEELFSKAVSSVLLSFPALGEAIAQYGMEHGRQAELLLWAGALPPRSGFDLLSNCTERSVEQDKQLLAFCGMLDETDICKKVFITAYNLLVKYGRNDEAKLMELLMENQLKDESELMQNRLCHAEDTIFKCFAALLEKPVIEKKTICFWKGFVHIQDSERIFADSLYSKGDVLNDNERDLLCRLLLSNPKQQLYWDTFLKIADVLSEEKLARAKFWKAHFCRMAWDECLFYVQQIKRPDLVYEFTLQMIKDNPRESGIILLGDEAAHWLVSEDYFEDDAHRQEALALFAIIVDNVISVDELEIKLKTIGILREMAVQAGLEEELIELCPELFFQDENGENGQGYVLLAQLLQKEKWETAERLAAQMRNYECESPFADYLQELTGRLRRSPELMQASGELADIMTIIVKSGAHTPNSEIYADYLVDCVLNNKGRQGVSVLLLLKNIFQNDHILDEMLCNMCRHVENDSERFQLLNSSLWGCADSALGDPMSFQVICKKMIAAYWLLNMDNLSNEKTRNPLNYFVAQSGSTNDAIQQMTAFYKACQALYESHREEANCLKAALYGVASGDWSVFFDCAMSQTEFNCIDAYKILFDYVTSVYSERTTLFQNTIYAYLVAVEENDDQAKEWLIKFAHRCHQSVPSEYFARLDAFGNKLLVFQKVLLLPLKMDMVAFKMLQHIMKAPQESIVVFFAMMLQFRDVWENGCNQAKNHQPNNDVLNICVQNDNWWKALSDCCLSFVPPAKFMYVYEELLNYVEPNTIVTFEWYSYAGLVAFDHGDDKTAFILIEKAKPFAGRYWENLPHTFMEELKKKKIKYSGWLSGIFIRNRECIKQLRQIRPDRLIKLIALLLSSKRMYEYRRLFQHFDSVQIMIAQIVWNCMAAKPTISLGLLDSLPEINENGDFVRCEVENYLNAFAKWIVSKTNKQFRRLKNLYQFILQETKFTSPRRFYMLKLNYKLQTIDIQWEAIHTCKEQGRRKTMDNMENLYYRNTDDKRDNEKKGNRNENDRISFVKHIFDLPFIKNALEGSAPSTRSIDELEIELNITPVTAFEEREKILAALVVNYKEIMMNNPSKVGKVFVHKVSNLGLNFGINHVQRSMGASDSWISDEAEAIFFQSIMCIREKSYLSQASNTDIHEILLKILLQDKSLQDMIGSNAKSFASREHFSTVLADKEIKASLKQYFDKLKEAGKILKKATDPERAKDGLRKLQGTLKSVPPFPNTEWQDLWKNLFLKIGDTIRTINDKPDLEIEIFNKNCRGDRRLYGEIRNKGWSTADLVEIIIRFDNIYEKIYTFSNLRQKTPFSVKLPDIEEMVVEYSIYARYYWGDSQKESTVQYGKVQIQESDDDYEDEYYIPKFDVTSPASEKDGVNEFVGRREERRALRHRILGSADFMPEFKHIPSYVFFGLKRTGKTSLLQQAQKMLEERGDILLCSVDAEGIEANQILDQVFIREPLKKLIECLKSNELECLGKEGLDEKGQKLERVQKFKKDWESVSVNEDFNVLKEFYRQYAELCAPLHLVLSVDEVEKVFDGAQKVFAGSNLDNRMFGTLRSILQWQPNDVHFLFCGSDQLTNYIITGSMSQVFQNMEQLHVCGMNQQDTLYVINLLCKIPGSCLKFYAGVQEMIWRYTGGMIWHVKLLLNLITGRLCNETRECVYPSDVIEELNILLRNPDVFMGLDTACTENELIVLKALASCQDNFETAVSFEQLRLSVSRYGGKISDESLHNALRSLETRTLIKLSEVEGESGSYSMLTDFYRLHRRNETVKTIVLKQKGKI